MSNRMIIIGSGFSGLAASCYAANAGNNVTVFEKNSSIGGRARQFSEQGYVFDMGPSWYWMPDVFERFFNDFGKSVSDYYDLVQLDPGFQVFFEDHDPVSIPASEQALYQLFERIEPGCTSSLKQFLADAEYKYRVGMQDLVYKPGLSLTEYVKPDVLKGVIGTHLFRSVATHVRKYFKDERLIKLMEFPVLFLGAMAKDIPALYTLMNYAALSQGTWYPKGGMYKIIEGMQQLASSLGVTFKTSTSVTEIIVQSGQAKGVNTDIGFHAADTIIASGDYNHVEQKLLSKEYRNYTENYWEKRTFAPSCLIYYVGVNKKIKKLIHHNLFFDADFERHAKDIYLSAAWPKQPLFYVCCPSKTDDTVAPEGHENLFILVPVAPGIEDTEEIRDRYFPQLIQRIEKHCGDTISEHVVYKKSYCVKDFERDYFSYKGNAYGLANTLRQTAILKPSLKNKKINNLVYTGQLTVPGPGVPPSLISGKLAAGLAEKAKKQHTYEAFI